MHAYVLWKRHKRLAAHLQGATRQQILQAKDRGEEVNEWTDQPEVAFSGDSTIEIDRSRRIHAKGSIIDHGTHLSG